MKSLGSKGVLLDLLWLSIFLVFSEEAFAAANGRRVLPPKPQPADAAATARWLASQSTWGVLSTISSELGGAPFGNVVSFSDGLPGDGHGIPYFYLTTLDPTARNALKDERSSFTLSEFPLGTCGKKDPENPTCSKLTLTGKLILVDGNTKEAEFAERVLFTKHPEMMGISNHTADIYLNLDSFWASGENAAHLSLEWPEDHDFQIFKLNIVDIFLIDWYGGAKPISVAQYLHPTLDENALAFTV